MSEGKMSAPSAGVVESALIETPLQEDAASPKRWTGGGDTMRPLISRFVHRYLKTTIVLAIALLSLGQLLRVISKFKRRKP